MGIGLAPKSSGPEMSALVQQAWKAKRRKGSKSPQAISPQDSKKLQTIPKAKEKPTYSPLLSRRLHKRVLLTIKVPPRQPFPPPLVWSKSPPRPPPRSPPGRLYARPYARPPARPHPYKRPQRSTSQQQVPFPAH